MLPRLARDSERPGLMVTARSSATHGRVHVADLAVDVAQIVEEAAERLAFGQVLHVDGVAAVLRNMELRVVVLVRRTGAAAGRLDVEPDAALLVADEEMARDDDAVHVQAQSLRDGQVEDREAQAIALPPIHDGMEEQIVRVVGVRDRLEAEFLEEVLVDRPESPDGPSAAAVAAAASESPSPSCPAAPGS